MFALTLNASGKRFALATAAVALGVGTACNHGPDDCGSCTSEVYAGVARGANVIPALAPADTSARASVFFNPATGVYVYATALPPSGAIDSIALYQIDAGATLPASATAILCAGVMACAATSGTARAPGGGWLTGEQQEAIRMSMRAFGTQVVFFTTTARADGAMRGTMFYSTGELRQTGQREDLLEETSHVRASLGASGSGQGARHRHRTRRRRHAWDDVSDSVGGVMPSRRADAMMAMSTLTLHGVLGLTVLPMSACQDTDAPPLELYRAYVSGARVIPPPASHADSSRSATVSVALSTSSGRLGYSYYFFGLPSDTIDVIALYQAGATVVLPPLAIAALCDGPEACATKSGTATLAPSATPATLHALLRADSLQVVFFTANAPWAAGGALRGTMSPYP